MIHKAKDLSSEQRVVIEALVGRRVLEDEAISVRAFDPPALSDERRREISEELKKYFSEVDAGRKPGPPEEAEQVLTDAIRSSRPGYRTRQ